MNVQDVVALVIVGGAVLLIVRRGWAMLRGRGGCACNKGMGKNGPIKTPNSPAMGLRSRPFLPLDRVGKPRVETDVTFREDSSAQDSPVNAGRSR